MPLPTSAKMACNNIATYMYLVQRHIVYIEAYYSRGKTIVSLSESTNGEYPKKQGVLTLPTQANGWANILIFHKNLI